MDILNVIKKLRDDLKAWVKNNLEALNNKVENKMNKDELDNAVNIALSEAKELGEFDGKDGVDGKDGYTPVKGVDYFDGIDGKDGAPGKDGVDGKDGLDGKDGVDGRTPEKGVDYFTDEDKQEFIEDVIENIDIPEGGVTSWNDLEDKPFGEIPPVFDITWDGDMTGHEIFDYGDGGYDVKVSDQVFTKEQLLNSTTFNSNSLEVINTEENISIYEEFGVIFLDGGMVIFSAEKFNSVAELPEGTYSNGVWFSNWTGENPYYVNRLVATTTIKKIDKEYLPDTEVSWNDLTDKPFGEETQYNLVVTSDVTTTDRVTVPFTAVVGKTYKIEAIDVGSNTILASIIKPCTALDFGAFIQYTISGPEVNCNSYDNSSWSFWVTGQVGQSTIFKVYEENVSFITIDEKYIPDTIATKQYVDEAIANTDKEVSWNNITDKPFYENIYEVEVASLSALSGSRFMFNPNNIHFIEGKTYRLEAEYVTPMVAAPINYQTTAVATGEYSLSFDTIGWTISDGGLLGGFISTPISSSLEQYITSGTCKIFEYGLEIKVLGEKFIPDSVVLESELEAKGYQTKEQVTELINNALGVIENGTY